jgi:hypothetical protein
VQAKVLSRRAFEEFYSLDARVREVARFRNMAFRVFAASRFAAITSAQREFWFEFAWLDQEYRHAVRRLAQFCLEHRNRAGGR